METKDKNYLYNIGDCVNGVIITEQCTAKDEKGWNRKAYKYTCSICGYDCGEYYKNGEYHLEHKIRENNLKHGAGCVICSKNGFVAPEINSIHAIAPFMEELLLNKEDALKYAPNSNVKLECRCPDCGKTYVRKCDKIFHYGVPCTCGDGFSYPEKFIYNMLNQLNVKFDPQFYLTKDSLLRYDFYLEEYKIILEVNGIQHYQEKWHYRNEVENDKRKKEFALSNGIKEENYIVLDCRESNLDFIKNSVLSSKLNEIFDFSKVDFAECSKFASNNFTKEACELWNNGNNVKEIAEKMKLDKHTIISYLKRGNDIGWCVYQVGDGVKLYNKKRTNKSGNGSGVIGVSWHKSSKKWVSRININGSRIEIGKFDDLNEAIVARLKSELENFGEELSPQKELFAKYNII